MQRLTGYPAFPIAPVDPLSPRNPIGPGKPIGPWSPFGPLSPFLPSFPRRPIKPCCPGRPADKNKVWCSLNFYAAKTKTAGFKVEQRFTGKKRLLGTVGKLLMELEAIYEKLRSSFRLWIIQEVFVSLLIWGEVFLSCASIVGLRVGERWKVQRNVPGGPCGPILHDKNEIKVKLNTSRDTERLNEYKPGRPSHQTSATKREKNETRD